MALAYYQMASSRSYFEQLSEPRKKAAKIVTQRGREHCATRCKVNNKVLQTQKRVAIYQPTIWTHDFIEGLETNLSVRRNTQILGRVSVGGR
ncbi:putative (E)-beta-ocimene synthase [Helianthus annuus]|uniref:(E)-beta-ocimene synthase n=1 Tax=Helianthus annuus TaxID=4232 RepID=A0A251RN77_HELAN|nr:putative (E)-beta-ocimene synthase [Helianthus annuus]KAJ0428439.1 putative (E)-beta-ocimene synthase [Helianthus annuus]KAJ0446778.1 putative (E)-beta-ocimene synthase [Helianthus annuus]KAJ0631671.1 putative (E)-beta-ocimene synthase [Helianthus annuus]KAJ0812325.1 putative (E)-beta-ocimene synthase [Helianthus annuus]